MNEISLNGESYFAPSDVAERFSQLQSMWIAKPDMMYAFDCYKTILYLKGEELESNCSEILDKWGFMFFYNYNVQPGNVIVWGSLSVDGSMELVHWGMVVMDADHSIKILAKLGWSKGIDVLSIERFSELYSSRPLLHCR